MAEGDERKGFIKRVREDGKIDLTLVKPGYEKVGRISTDILSQLKAAGGFLAVTDKYRAGIFSQEIMGKFRA